MHHRPVRARHAALAAAVAATLALTGCAGDDAGPGAADGDGSAAAAPTTAPPPSATPTADATPSTAPTASPSPSAGAQDTPPTPSAADFPDGIDPHRIRIPAIGVDAPVGDLTLTAEEVEVPEDFDATGWWTSTRRPGQIGPAVIGGHVDSRSGPAVFFDLERLAPGDEVVVVDEAGEEVVFVVDEGVQVDKYARPPEVFGFGEGRPELRLITCGGDFDPSEGHYEDNYVVFAHQADWEPS